MIGPLGGYVVSPAAADRVAAPVAEDLAPGQLERIVASNPDSSLCLIGDRPEAQARGRAYLERVTTDGTFVPTAGWWIYQISEGAHIQTGVVAEISVAAYDAGRVLRHEHTVADIASRVADMLEQVGGSAHPISLIYRAHPEIDDLVAAEIERPPDIRVAQGDRLQRAWLATETDALAAALDEVPTLYIADGHHRSAGAAALAHRSAAGPQDPRSVFLAVVFPHNQMRTLSYHRCLHLPDRSPQQVLAAIADRLEIRTMPLVEDGGEPEPGEVWITLAGRWYATHLPDPAGSGPTTTLDAARLQHDILGPICDVADPRDDPRLSYVPGSARYAELAAICRARQGVGFVTRAARVGDVMAVSDAGGIMPPKSTWFTPKIGAGLFLRRVDEC